MRHLSGITVKDANYFRMLKAEIGKKEKMYAYNIVHEMSIEPKNLFLATNLTPDALAGIIAYIEFIAFPVTFECDVSLSEEEVLEIVNRFYREVQFLPAPPCQGYVEIDLYENWEALTHYPFDTGIPELHRDGLMAFIKELSIRNNWKRESVE